MSYDLMVFDPAAAPQDRSSFMKWYEEQTDWGEGHSYDLATNARRWLR